MKVALGRKLLSQPKSESQATYAASVLDNFLLERWPQIVLPHNQKLLTSKAHKAQALLLIRNAKITEMNSSVRTNEVSVRHHEDTTPLQTRPLAFQGRDSI